MKKRLYRILKYVPAGLVLSVCAHSLPAQEEREIRISIPVQFEASLLPELTVLQSCRTGEPARSSFTLNRNQELEIGIVRSAGDGPNCRIHAQVPAAYSVQYSTEGGGIHLADANGCHFNRMESGQSGRCRIEVTQKPAKLMVYKKWNGAFTDDDRVAISLECESGQYSGTRYINQGAPDGWEIRQVSPEGILCNVYETPRENFRPDIIDCQGLYILPGITEECTMVNTKIVKRIEMLNRYGKIVMILLVLAVGLTALKRRT